MPCACGICGLSLPRFDLFGRPRRYLPGHNRPGQGRPKASRLAVLAALQSTTIPVNVTHFNGNPTQGSGAPGDPVRPL